MFGIPYGPVFGIPYGPVFGIPYGPVFGIPYGPVFRTQCFHHHDPGLIPDPRSHKRPDAWKKKKFCRKYDPLAVDLSL